MGNASFCDANAEDPNVSTVTAEDWSKEDLNQHLRELLLRNGSPPPRSVSIERTPMILLTQEDEEEDDDTTTSPTHTPKESSPPISLPVATASDEDVKKQPPQDSSCFEDEVSTHFVFEEVITSDRLFSDNDLSWYCSRLLRIVCLCFTLYLALNYNNDHHGVSSASCRPKEKDRYDQIQECSPILQRDETVMDWFYDGVGQTIAVVDDNCQCTQEFATYYQFLYLHNALNIQFPSQASMCDWETVLCHHGTYNVEFGAHAADGTVPFEFLEELSQVERLNLSFNPKLRGELRPNLSFPARLQVLDVRGTNVTGRVLCQNGVVLSDTRLCSNI